MTPVVAWRGTVVAMTRQGQVFEFETRDRDGNPLWAYRCRLAGRGSKRVQRGGFTSGSDPRVALGQALERARREQGSPTRSLTLAELVDEYLAQHDVEPATLGKLRWLLRKAVAAFGDVQVSELSSQEIAAWRMTISAGHRFEATQALRQVLARADDWGLPETNPAKVGVANPQRRPTEMRPFESWEQVGAVAGRLGRRYGARRVTEPVVDRPRSRDR
jgi:hypothetical protein